MTDTELLQSAELQSAIDKAGLPEGMYLPQLQSRFRLQNPPSIIYWALNMSHAADLLQGHFIRWMESKSMQPRLTHDVAAAKDRLWRVDCFDPQAEKAITCYGETLLEALVKAINAQET